MLHEVLWLELLPPCIASDQYALVSYQYNTPEADTRWTTKLNIALEIES